MFVVHSKYLPGKGSAIDFSQTGKLRHASNQSHTREFSIIPLLIIKTFSYQQLFNTHGYIMIKDSASSLC